MTFPPQPQVFEDILSGFLRQFTSDPDIADKLLKSGIIIRFNYTEPDCQILVDCSGEEIGIRPGDATTEPIVQISMKAEVAHKFWFGKVNLMQALARGQMKARGPVPRIIKLLPIIRPAYKMYPEYLRENGYEEYLL